MLAAAAILLIPLVAMQVSSEVVWTLSDFIFAWVLLTAFGVSYVTARDKQNSTTVRVIGGVCAAALVVLWVVLATA